MSKYTETSERIERIETPFGAVEISRKTTTGDSGRVYMVETSGSVVEYRPAMEGGEIAGPEILYGGRFEKNPNGRRIGFGGHWELPDGRKVYGCFRVDNPGRPGLRELVAIADKAKTQGKAETAAIHASLGAEARETGKDVVVDGWTEARDRWDSSLDVVAVVVTPDGELKYRTKQGH